LNLTANSGVATRRDWLRPSYPALKRRAKVSCRYAAATAAIHCYLLKVLQRGDSRLKIDEPAVFNGLWTKSLKRLRLRCGSSAPRLALCEVLMRWPTN